MTLSLLRLIDLDSNAGEPTDCAISQRRIQRAASMELWATWGGTALTTMAVGIPVRTPLIHHRAGHFTRGYTPVLGYRDEMYQGVISQTGWGHLLKQMGNVISIASFGTTSPISPHCASPREDRG